MTEIERKALALVNEVADAVRYEPDDFEEERRDVFKALCRAIEQHEAFRQEVSDEIVKLGCWPDTINLQRFIIAKPDPLMEVLTELGGDDEDYCDYNIYAEEIREALAKRGLEIREIK